MIDNQFQGAQVFTDIQGLGKLKHAAKVDESGALKEAAKQFESVFIGMMLKSMRDANAVFEEGNFLNSNQSKFYRDMFDQQLSLHLSQGNGIGLADVLVKQMARYVDDSSTDVVSKPDAENVGDLNLPKFNSAYQQVRDVLSAIEPETGAAERITQIQQTFDDPDDFIDTMLPYAREAAKELGIDARALVAQAALETGWGKHVMSGSDGNSSFNLFGIKADSRWQGESVSKTTLEFKAGVPEKQMASFRSYNSFEESFSDYVAFIKGNARYASALEQVGDPNAYAGELQKAGYATDPKYGEKISGIFDRYLSKRVDGDLNDIKQL